MVDTAAETLPRAEEWSRPIDSREPRITDYVDRAVALCLDYWDGIRSRPAYERAPDDLLDAMASRSLPRHPANVDDWAAELRDEITAHSMGVGHPRWWGFMHSSAHPAGVASELIAATLNDNCWGPGQLATDLELLVMEWIRELAGLPAGFGGILTTGGTTANLYALATARSWKFPDARREGLAAVGAVRVYASEEVHVSVPRALELLGYGRAALRLIPTDERRRMDVDALRGTIAMDRHSGRIPLAVVATAGTVATGAIDPLESIASVAAENDAWFHVDGALGAFAASLPEMADRLSGIEYADSVTADPHKWLYVPFEAGALLVREPGRLEAAFASPAGYLDFTEAPYIAARVRFADRGFELTRSFRALKVWSVLRVEGLEGLRRLWRNDLAVAQRIRSRIEAEPRLESLAPTDLNVFCFRYRCDDPDGCGFQRRLVGEIARDGRSFVGPVSIDGRAGLRGCVCNYRSTLRDADLFIDAVLEIAGRLDAGHALHRVGVR